MKFGFASTPVGPRGLGDDQLYREAIEDTRLGHALGFDSAWALEHHFTPYFPQPDLSVYLANVAAHCPGLGLGTCVIVLPWHHPLRLAEQIAMLSLLSTGNLYLGLGRGTARYEFDRLGVDMTQTRGIFQEMLEIIRKGLTGEPFSYEGKHFRFPKTRVRPKANLERIKLFGAIGSPESAGVMGDLRLPPIHTSNFPDDMAQGFVRTWQQHGGASDVETIASECPMMINPTIVATTAKEARELAHEYYPNFARVQMEHYESKDDYWKSVPGYEAHSRFFANLSRLVSDTDLRDRFFDNKLVGTPEQVIRRIEELRDKLMIGHVVTVHAQYEMERSLRCRSMQMFAEQVLPHFRPAAKSARPRAHGAAAV
jgi:alkanesulfonate monooxygenase SsuD/methylene tetrahydromethanopterin reductase-like flavin-dependent oxidoreductase (luciferase family)